MFCICENKYTDQFRGNREADQRLCFCYIDSIVQYRNFVRISSSCDTISGLILVHLYRSSQLKYVKHFITVNTFHI